MVAYVEETSETMTSMAGRPRVHDTPSRNRIPTSGATTEDAVIPPEKDTFALISKMNIDEEPFDVNNGVGF